MSDNEEEEEVEILEGFDIVPPPDLKEIEKEDEEFTLPGLNDPIFSDLHSNSVKKVNIMPPPPVIKTKMNINEFKFSNFKKMYANNIEKKGKGKPSEEKAVTPSDPERFYRHHFPSPVESLETKFATTVDNNSGGKSTVDSSIVAPPPPPPTITQNTVFPSVFAGTTPLDIPGLAGEVNIFLDDDFPNKKGNNNMNNNRRRRRKKKKKNNNNNNSFSSLEEEEDVFGNINNNKTLPVGVFWDVENVNFFRLGNARKREYFQMNNSRKAHLVYIKRMLKFCNSHGSVRDFKAYIDTGRKDLEQRYLYKDHCRQNGITFKHVSTFEKGRVIKEVVDCIMLIEMIEWACRIRGEKMMNIRRMQQQQQQEKEEIKKDDDDDGRRPFGIVVLISADSDFYEVIKELKLMNFKVVLVVDENQKLLVSQIELVDEWKTIGSIMDPSSSQKEGEK